MSGCKARSSIAKSKLAASTTSAMWTKYSRVVQEEVLRRPDTFAPGDLGGASTSIGVGCAEGACSKPGGGSNSRRGEGDLFRAQARLFARVGDDALRPANTGPTLLRVTWLRHPLDDLLPLLRLLELRLDDEEASRLRIVAPEVATAAFPGSSTFASMLTFGCPTCVDELVDPTKGISRS